MRQSFDAEGQGEKHRMTLGELRRFVEQTAELPADALVEARLAGFGGHLRSVKVTATAP